MWYENNNKPAQSTTENKLFSGQSDARSPVGEFARGSNVYKGGLSSATSKQGGMMQQQHGLPANIAKAAYKRLAKEFFGGICG